MTFCLFKVYIFFIAVRQRLRSRSHRAHYTLPARDHFHYTLRHIMLTAPVNPFTVIEVHLVNDVWNLPLIIVDVAVFFCIIAFGLFILLQGTYRTVKLCFWSVENYITSYC